MDRSKALSKLNSNSDSHKNIYIHQHSHSPVNPGEREHVVLEDAPLGHIDLPVDSAALASYVAEAGWPNASARRLDSFLMHAKGVRWSDIVACRTVLDQRDDVVDPVAYLFGLLKRRRFSAGLRTKEQDSSNSSFDSYVNGQKVKLRD